MISILFLIGYFITDLVGCEPFPQGLKPLILCGSYGTAEAVPFQDPIYATNFYGTEAVPFQGPIYATNFHALKPCPFNARL
jgi:hypothetical protein